jgi:Mn2+/Fe2+ NRAMP family transporter
VFGSLLLVPVLLMSHPPVPQVAHDLFVPRFPANAPVADVMLLIIAIVGTTVAPWQLFFSKATSSTNALHRGVYLTNASICGSASP